MAIPLTARVTADERKALANWCSYGLDLHASDGALCDCAKCKAQHTALRLLDEIEAREGQTQEDKDHDSRLAEARWIRPAPWQLHGRRGKSSRWQHLADVWANGTWHTWDANGTGGENARDGDVETAKHEAEKAVVRQGWGKWKGKGQP